MNMTVIWLAILVVLAVIELVTLGLTTIWFAGGSLVAAIAAALLAPIWLQIVLFFAVSLLLLFFTRPVAIKYFNKGRLRTNVESMVGQQAVVTKEINNLEGTGEVKVGGMEWTARTAMDGYRIQPGTVVIIRAVNGVKLIVEPR